MATKMKTEKYASKSEMMKQEKKTPMNEKMPKGKAGIAIMIGMPKKMATGGMPMVKKDGMNVPAFAADGVGKMAKGGAVKDKKMMGGGYAMKTPTMMSKGGMTKKKK
jgi:hypothetical protein